MIDLSALRAQLVLAMIIIATLVAGCANPAIEDAHRLAGMGQHEAALQKLDEAARKDQADRQLRNEVLMQRDATVGYLVYLADAARAAGRLDEVANVLKRMEAAAPQHPRVAWLRSELNRLERHQRLVADAQQQLDARAFDRADAALQTVLSEDPGNGKARAMMNKLSELRETQSRKQATLQLATATKPVTLEFREASVRTVFETLARAADVNFVFDKDVRSDAKVTLFLRNTTVDEAMRVILSTQQLSAKLLNDNTVLVFPATQQKQRDLLDTVTRTFYLVNADPKQALSLVRTVAKTRDIFVDERLNLLVVRDTPEVVRLVERLIQSIDLADPEVMLELEVMEVSNNQLNSLGLSWPTTVSYGVPGSTAPLTTLTGLQSFTTNPLAIATLRATHDTTNILANPKIRARNREKAKVLLGEKLPVFTTTSTPNNGSISNAVSINYVDVGLKLDVEPQVQLDNDVTIKVALEVSSITNKITGPNDSFAYQVGTRQATTTLRLRDGETQILAGLINDSESRSSAGIPGLHDMPIAGRLFGLTTNERKKSEIILLVTPHIVRNVIQPGSAASFMPSGTESQPGAPALILRDEARMSGLAAGGGGPTTARPAKGTGDGVTMSGPEEVSPGASFQVTLTNLKAQAAPVMLVIDPTVLELEGGANGDGRLTVTLPPNGSHAVNVRMRPDTPQGEALLVLEPSGASWRIKVRNEAASSEVEDH
ncbi:MAG TPA: secretin N-terminal domain-containing protein [Aquabacterium sp.]|uniref:secretin N-terminal domain-containing protein n=1 Tax=Aquabacterium sp. TaxID=1872578 RepID=UPI002E33D65B|nr:secretin N-terminal domain-containing protein [Aquabacterium sp.]HEX5357280.1 secretin N-terminal domain-containing protein [Aquabacterium sp.]